MREHMTMTNQPDLKKWIPNFPPEGQDSYVLNESRKKEMEQLLI